MALPADEGLDVMYALMCADAASDGRDTRAAVDETIAGFAEKLLAGPAAHPAVPAAAPRRSTPDPATWGLLPHQIAKAEAAQKLGGG